MNFVLTIKGKHIGSGTYAEMLDLADRHGVIGRRWHKDGTELASALARGCALYPVADAFGLSKPLSAA